MKKLLALSTILAFSTIADAQAVYDVARGKELKRVEGIPSKQVVVEKQTIIDAGDTPVAGSANTSVKVYTPTDGNISYNDKNLVNYQDPYLTNSRAYKSNEYGDAAQPPKMNVFSTVRAPSYRESAPEEVNTEAYVGE